MVPVLPPLIPIFAFQTFFSERSAKTHDAHQPIGGPTY